MQKNILIIIPQLTGGGAEKTAANLANFLSDIYQVTVVVIDGRNRTYEVSTDVIDLKMNIFNKKNKFRWYYDLIKKIRNIKLKKRIDVSISFLDDADFGNIFTKQKHEKTIISIRNKLSALNASFIGKLRSGFLMMRADTIIAISEMVKYDLINNYNVNVQKIKVIYNPSNKDVIMSAIRDTDVEEIDKWIFDSEKVVINIGRLTEQKGQWHIIRAFSKVVEEIPNAKLVILGQGELEDYLSNLIKEYKLHLNIFLLGYKRNPYPYIKKSNLFVFGSLFEGLGNSIIESLSCETLVLSTDCDSGPREILYPSSDINATGLATKITEADFGILVPVFDGIKYDSLEPLTNEELMMAEAIITYLNSKALRLHYEKMAIQAVTRFNEIDIINAWIREIDS